MPSVLVFSLAVVALLAALLGGVFGRRARRRAAELEGRLAARQEEVRLLRRRERDELEVLGAALWEWSVPDGKIHLSDRFQEITGHDRAGFGSDIENFFACIHADDRSEARAAFDAYLERRTAQCVADVRFRRLGGDYIWLHLQAVGEWDADGQPQSLVGWLADMTSKMEAEEERDRLFNLSIDMLAVGGFDQYLQQINPAWVRVLGWSRDELMGHPLPYFIHEDDRALTAQAWDSLREGAPIEGLENRFRCRDGTYRWLSWGSFPYADRQLVFSVVRDITVHKRAEQQLLDYQDRLRSLSSQLALVEDRQRRELAAAIHDGLAQQLFGIRAQMVLLKYPDKVPNLPGVVAQIIEILDETMADARSLSFELFPPVLYELGLDAAIVWLAHSFGERNGLHCTTDTEGECAQLPEDQRSMAYQCVRELLANINKHAEASNVHITLNYVSDFLTIVVEDDGKGFDVAGQERPRQVGPATGGFGLFSIRERLRSSGGRMLVDSKPGGGTRIFLTFPRHADGEETAATPLPSESPDTDTAHG